MMKKWILRIQAHTGIIPLTICLSVVKFSVLHYMATVIFTWNPLISTASSDSVVNKSTCHGSSASATLPRHSPAITGCQCGDKCHCSMRNYVTTTVLAQSQHASGRTKEIIVHTSDALQIHQRHQDLLLPSFSDAGHCGKKLWLIQFNELRKNKASFSCNQLLFAIKNCGYFFLSFDSYKQTDREKIY